MPMISFAQNAEDVLLRRLFPDARQGFYVDIGASHPIRHSVTKHFYDRGWRGVNVEPVPTSFAELAADRTRDLNLNLAVSDHAGRMVLHEPPASLGMATLSLPFAAGLVQHGFEYLRRDVEVTTLADLCADHVGSTQIDFLKIDVEGHEREVIAAADWRRWRPRAVVIEATVEPDTWESMLLRADYLPSAFDGLNRYYIRAEDAHLAPRLATPANVLDDFITFDHWWQVEDLRVQCRALTGRLNALEASLDGLGPTSLAAARRLRNLLRRVPAAGGLARRWLGRAG